MAHRSGRRSLRGSTIPPMFEDTRQAPRRFAMNGILAETFMLAIILIVIVFLVESGLGGILG